MTYLRTFSMIILPLLLLSACSSKTGPGAGENIFREQTMQKIYSLQDERNTADLLPFLEDPNPVYRRAAVLAFASVQDAAAVEKLAAKLSDANESVTVRSAAAYALGQIADAAAEPLLNAAFEKETAAIVRRDILEALGKCGTLPTLENIARLKWRSRDDALLLGQARALYRFALRNITSPEGTARAFELLAPGMPPEVSLMAGHYLARVRGIDLTPYAGQLLEIYQRLKTTAGSNTDTVSQPATGTDNLFTRMSLVLAMGKVKPEAGGEALPGFLTDVLSGDHDYRIKVNALRALESFPYEKAKDTVLSLAIQGCKAGNADAAAADMEPAVVVDTNTAVRAAEYILSKGIPADGLLYSEKALLAVNWRCRALLLQAALRYSFDQPAQAEKISKTIISAYEASANPYEKGNLLLALSENPAALPMIESQVFPSARPAGTEGAVVTPPVIKSLGMAALINMRSHKEFPVNDKKMRQRFAEIFKKGIASGDTAVMGQAALILREPSMNFKDEYADAGFLEEALNKLQLPSEIEAYQNLAETIAFFYPDKEKLQSPIRPGNPIAWQRVAAVAPGQIVKVGTTKGDIYIKLYVNESPGSVANFLRLVEARYYNGSVFHRVVPNFVVQVGCPRGDGWGGPDFSIRSEFGPLYYEEGSVGMASSGKDTEGSQWFITHSPTPHLNGSYTIFGKVTGGMDVVHRLEVGDSITVIE